MTSQTRLSSFDAALSRSVSSPLPLAAPHPEPAVAVPQSGHVLGQIFDSIGHLPILDQHLPVEEQAAGQPLTYGNHLELFTTGPESMEAMLAAMEGALDSINLESYIYDDDKYGRAVTDMLIRKQRQGVQCNLIYDGLGSRRVGQAYFGRLQDTGGRVLRYNPLRWYRPDHWNHRDHRKLLIVDGQAAFTGGVNVSDAFSNASFFEGERQKLAGQNHAWRDSHLRVEGAAATGFQRLFIDTWKRQTGVALADREYCPAAPMAGPHIARVIATTHRRSHGIYASLLSAVRHAFRSIHWTTAFFAPNAAMVDALSGAARRGVDVRLILPGFGESGLVMHAKHAYYQELMEAGVQIYERDDCMMHAKTLVIDGIWTTVGSANLDTRSFLHNDEANLVVLGPEFGTRMETLFAEDLVLARPVDSPDWASRPLKKRAKERAARLFSYWL
jgi:cardiolipin synthase A/B